MELKWTDSYNCHTAHLIGSFYLHVNWAIKSRSEPEHPDGPYEVRFNDMVCKKRARNVQEGKELAVRFARKILSDALTLLPDSPAKGEK